MNTVLDLPFNRFLGLELAKDDAQLLRLPAGSQYFNHLGTVHASALVALAEASSGEFLLRHFGSTDGLIPVVRRLESKFRKPANGSIQSRVHVAPETLAHLDTELGTKGRASVSLTIELHDESGAHVLSANVEWFVQRIPPPSSPQHD